MGCVDLLRELRGVVVNQLQHSSDTCEEIRQGKDVHCERIVAASGHPVKSLQVGPFTSGSKRDVAVSWAANHSIYITKASGQFEAKGVWRNMIDGLSCLAHDAAGGRIWWGTKAGKVYSAPIAARGSSSAEDDGSVPCADVGAAAVTALLVHEGRCWVGTAAGEVLVISSAPDGHQLHRLGPVATPTGCLPGVAAAVCSIVGGPGRVYTVAGQDAACCLLVMWDSSRLQELPVELAHVDIAKEETCRRSPITYMALLDPSKVNYASTTGPPANPAWANLDISNHPNANNNISSSESSSEEQQQQPYLLTGHANGLVVFWECVDRLRPLALVPCKHGCNAAVRGLGVMREAGLLLAGLANGKVCVHRLQQNTLPEPGPGALCAQEWRPKTLVLQAHRVGLRQMTVCGAGHIVTAGRTGSLKVWHVKATDLSRRLASIPLSAAAAGTGPQANSNGQMLVDNSYAGSQPPSPLGLTPIQTRIGNLPPPMLPSVAFLPAPPSPQQQAVMGAPVDGSGSWHSCQQLLSPSPTHYTPFAVAQPHLEAGSSHVQQQQSPRLPAGPVAWQPVHERPGPYPGTAGLRSDVPSFNHWGQQQQQQQSGVGWTAQPSGKAGLAPDASIKLAQGCLWAGVLEQQQQQQQPRDVQQQADQQQQQEGSLQGGEAAAGGPRSFARCTTEKWRSEADPWKIEHEELTEPEAHWVDTYLGKGSFGKVVVQVLCGEHVAVKYLTSDDLGSELSTSQLSAIRKEVEALQNVNHSNVLQLKGVCLKPPAVVTELCANGSLYDVLKKSRMHRNLGLTVSQQERQAVAKILSNTLEVAQQVASGMWCLHSRDILHRDLKTPNLFVTAEGVIKVGDTGLSQCLPTGQDYIKSYMQTNPYWCAPELLQCELPKHCYSKSSDVFAFGIIAWELLTHEEPWSHVHVLPKVQPLVVANMIIAGERPLLPASAELAALPGARGLAPDVLDGFVSLMRRCWAQDANERPDFKFVVNELQRLKKQQRAVRASSSGSSGVLAEGVPAAAPSSGEAAAVGDTPAARAAASSNTAAAAASSSWAAGEAAGSGVTPAVEACPPGMQASVGPCLPVSQAAYGAQQVQNNAGLLCGSIAPPPAAAESAVSMAATSTTVAGAVAAAGAGVCGSIVAADYGYNGV